MAILYSIHPDNPQTDRIETIVRALRGGAVMLYPTDTVYAIGCDLNAPAAVKRVRQLKRMANDKPLTFLCSSLSNIAEYALVADQAYRLMRCLIPGPYTFLLPATKLVPRVVMNPKRKTTGIRVPNQPVCQSILAALGNPVISTSAYVPTDEDGTWPTLGIERMRLFDALDTVVDIIIDTGVELGFKSSTILDLTTDTPRMVRAGLGVEALEDWMIDRD
ncbi:L-threonylcarbamoyladenylate synthase [Spirulina major]|uniref:L-threonylcarbamoyladenylate synthase n=1 Tax=Spirulina major TaxID=270636 RepID=UPI0009353EE2|nr:L-threonylcarbamoyladenylate synthase [Spirulina major]